MYAKYWPSKNTVNICDAGTWEPKIWKQVVGMQSGEQAVFQGIAHMVPRKTDCSLSTHGVVIYNEDVYGPRVILVSLGQMNKSSYKLWKGNVIDRVDS